MRNVTAQDLRDLIEEAISASIDLHRGSRISNEGASYECPEGRPTDEEIDDFILSNPLLDEETQEQLSHPGLLGFPAKTARASESWLRKFRRNVSGWAQNNSWLGADLPWTSRVIVLQPAESTLWRPTESGGPGWLATAPAALLLAADLLQAGRLLSEMPWRKFEEMIGALLETEGWTVQVTQPSKDGGIDVVAMKDDRTLGLIKAVWQAKRYGPKRTVRLSECENSLQWSTCSARLRASLSRPVDSPRMPLTGSDETHTDWTTEMLKGSSRGYERFFSVARNEAAVVGLR
jgi:restriction endonuclease